MTPMIVWAVRLRTLVAAGAIVGFLISLPGCGVMINPKPPPAPPGRLTPEQTAELDQATYAFSDRFVTLLSDACDKAAKGNPSPEARRQALRVKLHNATSAYDIATGIAPLGRLVDLLTIVTLGKTIWVDEGRARTVFGERGAIIAQAFQTANDDVWGMAERFLRPDEQQQLRDALAEWRRRNPDVTMAAYVRFEDFAGQHRAGGGSTQASGIFAAVADANRSIESTRELAERVFFYAQRMPRLLQWQTERTVEAVLDHPDIGRILATSDRIGLAAETVATEVRSFESRNAQIQETLTRVAAMIDNARVAGETFQGVLQEGQRVLVSAQATSADFTEAMTALDHFYAQVNSGPPSPTPFDVRQYTQAAEQMAVATAQMSALVRDTDTLLGSKAWGERVGEINTLFRRRIDHASWRVAELLVLLFGLLLGYRWILSRMART